MKRAVFGLLLLQFLVGCHGEHSQRLATAIALVRSESSESILIVPQQSLMPVAKVDGAIGAPLRRIIPEHGNALVQSASSRKLLTPHPQTSRRLQQFINWFTPQSNTYGVSPVGGTTYSGWQDPTTTPAYVQPTTTSAFWPWTNIWGVPSAVDTQQQQVQPTTQQQPAPLASPTTTQQTVQPAAPATPPPPQPHAQPKLQPVVQTPKAPAPPQKPTAAQPATVQSPAPPRRQRQQRQRPQQSPQPAAAPAPQAQQQQQIEPVKPAQQAPAVAPPSSPAAQPAAVQTTVVTRRNRRKRGRTVGPSPAATGVPGPSTPPATPRAAPAAEPSPSPAAPAAAAPVSVAAVTQEPQPSPSPSPTPIPNPTAPQQAKYCIPATRGMQFNVLAAGDSITQGAVPSKNYNHPFTIKLKEMLRRQLGKNADATDAGLGGGGVFMDGFSNPVKFGPYYRSYLEQVEWNVAVITIGINDLLRGGFSAVDIMSGLQPLYEQTLAKGIPVVAMPPFAAPGFVSQADPKEGERRKLASLISEAADRRQSVTGGQGPQIFVLDLQAGPLDFWKMSESDRQQFLDDGLHLTEMGYDLMGQLVYETVNALFCSVENPTITLPDPHKFKP